MIKLAFTGFLQVFFVCVNTYFVTKGFYIGVAVTSFLISFIWSFNVKKIAFGTMADRVVYASGASVGALVALLSCQIFIK